MIESLFQKKSECCGCEACANVCPKKIIEMKPDDEGFFYPQLVRPQECIGCHLCEKVCPIKNVSEVFGFQEKTIAGYSLFQKEIKNSASGGLGTAMAKGFVNNGGVVYGVAYKNNFREVEYGRASTLIELEQFRTSKYVQSRKKDVFHKVKSDLDKGTRVLFVGLPCDTYALQLFLNERYENLYVCALICHGPTSVGVHKQFTQKLIDEQKSEIQAFSVRYKKDGWKPYYIRTEFKNGNESIERFSDSTYGVAFQYMKRPSCNECPIKRSKIHSDITIGDYHLAAGGRYKPYHPDGVSSAFIHTKKGEHLLAIADNFMSEEIPIRNALYSEAYYRAIPARENREEFGRVFSVDGLDAACKLESVRRIERELAIKVKIRELGAKVKKLVWENNPVLK